MTYYTVREIVLPCITYDERMHFQVVIKGVNAIYQSKSNEYNATSKIQQNEKFCLIHNTFLRH